MKNLDALQASMQNQKESVLIDSKGTSIQYWCGVEAIGGDYGNANSGSVDQKPDGDIPLFDYSDCPDEKELTFA